MIAATLTVSSGTLLLGHDWLAVTLRQASVNLGLHASSTSRASIMLQHARHVDFTTRVSALHQQG